MSDDLFFGSGRRRRHPENKKMFLVGSKLQVFNGNAHHTESGLIQSELKMNKRNHVVSRRASNAGVKKNPQWIAAIKRAAHQLKRSGKKYTIKDIAHLAQDLYKPGPKRSASHKKKKKTSTRRRRISSVMGKMPVRRRRSSKRKSYVAHVVPKHHALPSYSATKSTSPPRRSSRHRKQTAHYSP